MIKGCPYFRKPPYGNLHGRECTSWEWVPPVFCILEAKQIIKNRRGTSMCSERKSGRVERNQLDFSICYGQNILFEDTGVLFHPCRLMGILIMGIGKPLLMDWQPSFNMEVSWNRGTPESSSISNDGIFHDINHPAGGTSMASWKTTHFWAYFTHGVYPLQSTGPGSVKLAMG